MRIRHRTEPRGSAGFGASIAVMLLSLGSFALASAALCAAIVYSDMADRSEARIQSSLDAAACADTVALMRAKDAFASGRYEIPEFGCSGQF